MANVPLTSGEEPACTAMPRRRQLLRVISWAVVGVALAVVFVGYQQVDLAITWITAKLC